MAYRLREIMTTLMRDYIGQPICTFGYRRHDIDGEFKICLFFAFDDDEFFLFPEPESSLKELQDAVKPLVIGSTLKHILMNDDDSGAIVIFECDLQTLRLEIGTYFKDDVERSRAYQINYG